MIGVFYAVERIIPIIVLLLPHYIVLVTVYY
jgi:hypothetical protein